ncbi:MAG: hypothetical protein ACP5U2_06200 [Bryobacteraceae bacterium]
MGLLLARRFLGAVLYFGAAAPALAGWAWWTWTHKYSGANPSVIYHTDYIRFYLETVRLTDLPVLLWGNLGGILIHGGKLIVPTPGESTAERIFCMAVTALTLMGVWRLRRRSGLTHYHLYAAEHLLLLVPWNFPFNARLLFLLAPLLMAGLLDEARRVVTLARAGLEAERRDERAIALVMPAILAAMGAVGAWRWSRPLDEFYIWLSERYRRQ